MALCEMCGKVGQLVVADVEGIELTVCPSCAGYGVIRRKVIPVLHSPRSHNSVQKEAPELVIVFDYSSLLRSQREKEGMSQEEFAKFLNEKESSLAKWEAGTLKPSIETAQKLEKRLGITLVRQEEAAPAAMEKQGKTDELTLGDFVKVRKRK